MEKHDQVTSTDEERQDLRGLVSNDFSVSLGQRPAYPCTAGPRNVPSWSSWYAC